MTTQGTRPRERSVRLFLGNLSYDATEAHISQALQGCSGVLYVGIRRAPDTQKSRGHGQVEFATEEDALRAIERLQGLEIKGRSVRVDWCEPPLRRKYAANNQQGLSGLFTQKEGGTSTVDLFDADGCLTAAALSAAEGVTLGDLEQILDEIALLVPSTGSLLQQLLQESPLLRAALLQAQLLLGRHEQLDLSNVSASALKRAEEYSLNRLLVECRALRPPTLPVLTITPPPETLSKSSVSTSSAKQKKSEVAKQQPTAAARRPAADPPRVPQTSDPCLIVSAPSGGPSWRYSPIADGQSGVVGGPHLSPLTPEPPVSNYDDSPEAKNELASLAATPLPQKRKREGEAQQQPQGAPSVDTDADDNKRACGTSRGPPPASNNDVSLLAAEAANVTAAPDHLVDELLRSQQLLDKVIQMSTTDLLQLDNHQRQQILSFRKALSLRGKFTGPLVP